MPAVTSTRPRAARFNANDIGRTDGRGSALGTFAAVGQGAPFKDLTFVAKGRFTANLPGGSTASGTFTFHDGAAAFADTLRLTRRRGEVMVFAVTDATKDGKGRITALQLAEPTDRGIGRAFSLRLR